MKTFSYFRHSAGNSVAYCARAALDAEGLFVRGVALTPEYDGVRSARPSRRRGVQPLVAAAICAFSSAGMSGAVAQTVPPAPGITCSAPTTVAGGTPNGVISADTPSSDNTRLYPLRSAFKVQFVTNAPSADVVNWSVTDYVGNTRGSGTFAVPPGVQTSTLSCAGVESGYFALRAYLSKLPNNPLPSVGTRPQGIATFGVLPDVSLVPAVTFTNLEQHRFGMQGESDKPALLKALGVRQVIDSRQLSVREPKEKNTWTPVIPPTSTSVPQVFQAQYNGNSPIGRLVRLDGIPNWASPAPDPSTNNSDRNHAPTDLTYYQGYMARVGRETESIRQAYIPTMAKNYYQVTWEPGWQDTAANFVAMYQAVYNGLHSTDPNAVVMGVTSPDPGMNKFWSTGSLLKTYGALGLGNYIDGVTTHSYYANYVTPSTPPEAGGPQNALPDQMRALRAQMQALKPNMRLWSTEVGVAYDQLGDYSPAYPPANQLFAQAAVAARAHLIVLGEGAQVSYFFYGADFPQEVRKGNQPGNKGYGSFFDLADAQGTYRASKKLSPKPEALAFAAMTRIVDGTQTLGRLNGLPPSVYGYAFQQLNNGPVITALWTHSDANWQNAASYSTTASASYALTVDAPGTSGNVTVFDMMGNPSTVQYANGVVNLTLSETPIYVLSSNANVIRANVTAPVGYTGQ